MIGFIFFGSKATVQVIGKEKNAKDAKHDKQFDNNNDPKRSANGHAFQSIAVENIKIFENSGNVHRKTID